MHRSSSAGIDALGYGESGKRLVRLCIALQVHQGSEPFFISARQAGEQVGTAFQRRCQDAARTCGGQGAGGGFQGLREGGQSLQVYLALTRHLLFVWTFYMQSGLASGVQKNLRKPETFW
jgi:hypothetical protein